MSDAGIVIRNYLDEIHGELGRMTLDLAGIPARLRKDDCGGMRPYMQIATGVQLIVRTEDARRASEILAEAESEHRKD